MAICVMCASSQRLLALPAGSGQGPAADWGLTAWGCLYWCSSWGAKFFLFEHAVPQSQDYAVIVYKASQMLNRLD